MTNGICLAAAGMRPQCKVIAVEPKGKDLWRNPPQFLDTIAEGIKTQQVGQLTFPLLCEHVSSVVTVTDKEMSSAMKLVAERMKIVIEAASGAAVAAALSDQIKHMEG